MGVVGRVACATGGPEAVLTVGGGKSSSERRRVAGGETGRTSVVGALKQLIIVLPGWLYAHYFGFLLIYGIGAFLLWALFGGAIARLAAIDTVYLNPWNLRFK